MENSSQRAQGRQSLVRPALLVPVPQRPANLSRRQIRVAAAGVPFRVGLCFRLVNTGLDLLPTLLDFAGLPRPAKLTGLSLRSLTTGEHVAAWRDQVVVENNRTEAAIVGDFVPMTEGRMVRTERYKYCVFAHGQRRESLVDLESDPGETIDLASDPAHRTMLLEHRDRLRTFGIEHGDALVATLLEEDVAPRPFSHVAQPKYVRSFKVTDPGN